MRLADLGLEGDAWRSCKEAGGAGMDATARVMTFDVLEGAFAGGCRTGVACLLC